MSLAISEVMYRKPFSLFVIVSTINIVTIFITMTRKFLQIVINDLNSYFFIRFLTYKPLIFNPFMPKVRIIACTMEKLIKWLR